jgi:hypothetical protein
MEPMEKVPLNVSKRKSKTETTIRLMAQYGSPTKTMELCPLPS